MSSFLLTRPPPRCPAPPRKPIGYGRTSVVLLFASVLLWAGALSAQIVVPQRSGFPVTLPGAGITTTAMPLVVDLDNDGVKEIVVGTAGSSTSGGKLYVVNANGTIRFGWPQTLSGGIFSSPSAGDLDGDGFLEIVVGCGNPLISDRPGGVYAFRRNGALLWHLLTQPRPPGLAAAVWSTPALGDLDGDGKDDVVFGAMDQLVYVLKGTTGLSLPGWPFFLRDDTWSSPVLADLDGDGVLEIAIGAYVHLEPPPLHTPDGAALWVFRNNGSLFPGFPQFTPQIPNVPAVGNYSSPAVGDIDGDGCPEIVIGTESTNTASGRWVMAFNTDGSPAAGFPYTLQGFPNSSPALADLDGDGVLDVIIADDGNKYSQTPPTPKLYGLKCNGQSPNPPVTELFRVSTKTYNGLWTWDLGEPTVARANGVDSVIFTGGAGFDVTLVSKTGVQLSGDNFLSPNPVYTTGHPVVGSAVADIDGNGTLFLVAASGVDAINSTDSRLFVWPLGTAGPNPLPWPMFHRDTKRQGSLLASPTPTSCRRVPPASKFFPIYPCRVSDSRLSGNLCFGGPALTGGETRVVTIVDNEVRSCGVATDAKAVALNVTVTGGTADGKVIVFPAGEAVPSTTTVSFRAGQERATEVIAPLSYEGRGNVAVHLAQPAGTTTHVIIDVNGYFK